MAILGNNNPFGDPSQRPDPGFLPSQAARDPGAFAPRPPAPNVAPFSAGTRPMTPSPGPGQGAPPQGGFIDQNMDGIDDRLNELKANQITMKYQQDMAKQQANVQQQYWKKMQAQIKAQQQAQQQAQMQQQVGPPPQILQQYGQRQGALDALQGSSRTAFQNPFLDIYNAKAQGKATTGSGSTSFLSRSPGMPEGSRAPLMRF